MLRVDKLEVIKPQKSIGPLKNINIQYNKTITKYNDCNTKEEI